MTSFKELGLAAPILSALSDEGYANPTPIQAQAIPHVMAGRDLMGIAQTGTGKTAAFTLPILHNLAAEKGRTPPRQCRVLILSPTRELAGQIADSVRAYSRHMRISVATVFGGVSHGPQAQMLQRGVDVLVATPGRLLDHMATGSLRLDGVKVFVLDEADQMLDMGFIHSIRKLVKVLPKQRQTLFFSATMPKEIAALAADMLDNPERVAVAPVSSTAERVTQKVVFVDAPQKRVELAHLLANTCDGRTLVFTRTKHGADRVVRHLESAGLTAAAIHGNKSQGQRQRALDGFKDGSTRILVATDIAARGIDVDGVTHVVNFELPNVPETYVHRIGRTARAGASGSAISLVDREERGLLRQIERLTRQSIPVEARATEDAEIAPEAPRPPRQQQRRPQGAGRGDGQRGEGRDGQRGQRQESRGRNGQGNGGNGQGNGGRRAAPAGEGREQHAAPRAGAGHGRDHANRNGAQRRGPRPEGRGQPGARREGGRHQEGHGGDLAGIGFMNSPRGNRS
ncbi:DEAD/DEAH box helicase [Camelimonas lactis]|uniref:DEAD-box ATP-dependent RNA helicase RhpA n=1 Tax=Camelimonas lactis TaxID=659006 RepID=A0A4V2RXZ0_9HYPH|nr:DEAD/DEAH box helicase [Camelimonas lactis]TCO16308.1 ATP-dependent RNA helicase RhlE [Camelimonas lactis]